MANLQREVDRLREQLAPYFGPDLHLRVSDNEEASSAEPALTAGELSLVRIELRPRLFDYQRDLVSRLVRDLENGKAGLLSLPTGGGKTRTGVVACLDAFAEVGLQRIAWLAPSRELVDQAIDTLGSMWQLHGRAPDMRIARDYPRGPGPLVWATTPQGVYARTKAQLPLGSWDAVVFDEAHQMAARTYEAAVTRLRAEASTVTGVTPGLVGLSATPGRASQQETQRLVELFGGRLLTSPSLGKNPVLTLQRRGILARLSFRRFTSREVPVQDEVTRIRIAVKAAERLVGSGRHVLVFTATVAGAVCMAEILRSLDVPARAVHAQMGLAERLATIDSFSRFETKVLVNQRLLATGYDCPAVSDVLLLTQIGSPILFEQVVGRAARGPRTGGGSTATVWEFDDHLSLHGLPSSYYRYRDYEWA